MSDDRQKTSAHKVKSCRVYDQKTWMFNANYTYFWTTFRQPCKFPKKSAKITRFSFLRCLQGLTTDSFRTRNWKFRGARPLNTRKYHKKLLHRSPRKKNNTNRKTDTHHQSILVKARSFVSASFQNLYLAYEQICQRVPLLNSSMSSDRRQRDTDRHWYIHHQRLKRVWRLYTRIRTEMVIYSEYRKTLGSLFPLLQNSPFVRKQRVFRVGTDPIGPCTKKTARL